MKLRALVTVIPFLIFLSLIMQNIPTEDLINELERRVDCSKRRGVRTILIGIKLLFLSNLRTSWLW